MTNIFNYAKNVAKSVMYSSVDTLTESATTTKEFISTNKDVISSLYSSMKNLRTIRKRATTYVNNSKLYEAADEGIKAVFEDIKTGKFYNRERIAKFEDKVASSMMDGFDLDFDDMGLDQSFDTSTSASEETSMGDLEATVALSSKDNAAAVSSTVARVGSHMASVSRTNTMMLVNEQIKANNIMEKGFSSIFDRIGETSKINADIAATQAENSKKFFEVTTSFMQEQNRILKEMLELQKANAAINPAKSNTTSSSSSPKFSDIVGFNGEVNLKAYAKNIMTNFKNALPASLNMVNSLGGENSNPFLMFAASPLQFIPNFIAKTLIPKATKKAVEDFDKTLSGAFSGIMASLKKMENGSIGYTGTDSDFFKQEIGRYIGQIFGVRTGSTREPNPRDYNKGTMPWNGLAQKSIIEVIPGYLRRIESLLSGQDERVYSWSSGKWTTGKALKQERDSISENAYRDAYREIKSQMTELLRDSAMYTNEQWKSINDQMTGFLKTIVESDYGNPRFKDGAEKNYARYKVEDEETMKLLLAAFKATDRRERAQLSRKAFQARDTLSNRLNNLFKDNVEMLELFNGSDVDKGYNPSWTNGGRRTAAPGFVYNNAIDKILDDKGHNVFYYLQHIYDEFVTFRVNNYGASQAYERSSRTRNAGVPTVVNASGSRDSRYIRINSRNNIPTSRYLEINPMMPDDSVDRRQQDADNLRITEEYERLARRAHDQGRRVFNKNDTENNRAILSSIKDSGNKWYGDNTYDSYRNSRSMREYLSENGTIINDRYNRAKDRRRSQVDEIDSRIFGDVNASSNGKKPKLFDRLLAAETITEKMAVFTNSVDNLLEAPQKFLTNIMLKADQRLYSLVFGDDETHYVNGKPVNGILDEIIYQVKGTFTKLNDWIGEKILNPLKNKGINGPGDLIQYIGEIFGVDLKGTKDSILNWLFKKNGAVRGIGANLRDTAGAMRNFMAGGRQSQQANASNPRREEVNQRVSNNIKRRQDNINFFDMMRDYADYLGFGSEFDNGNGADVLLKIANDLYGEYVPVENIDDVSSEFIQNFIGKSTDSRIKGKANLGEIKKTVSNKDYKEILASLIAQYNENKVGELNRKRNEMMALQAAVPGLDLNSEFLKALANGSMTKEMIDSKMRFFERHRDYASTYDHNNPSNNKYDNSRKKFAQEKNQRLAVLNNFLKITGDYKSIDDLPADVEQLLADNPDMLAETLREKINNKLDEIYASDAEEITKKFDINKIIADSGNNDGKASIDRVELNKLLRKLNRAVSKFNSNNASTLNNSLIEKLQELSNNNSSMYNIEEAKRLGLNVVVDGNGNITDIQNTPEEIIRILTNEYGAISTLASGTRYVTKTGLTTIHEGEMVIPSELNPFNPNRGKVSKSTEVANENRVKNKFLSALSKKIGRRASGDKGDGTPIDSGTAKAIQDASASMQSIDEDSYIKFINQDGDIVYRIKQGTDDRGREIWRQTTVSRAEANTNGLSFDPSVKDVPPLTVGKVSNLSRKNTGEFMRIGSPENLFEKAGKHIKTAVANAGLEEEYAKATDAVKKYGTAGAAGGILGGGIGLGLSALMGLPGGPIIGAAVGAIGNIARKSKTVNEALFGKVIGTDEEGNEQRTGGLIDSEIQNAFKKYFPSMAKFGLGGAAVGLLTPLGPVGGAIVGSAIGFMKKSDEFSGFLFGDEGIFSLEDKEKFKKALPNMGLGAAAGALSGMLGGPFGLVGGALVGSAGGFLTTTDKFKELVLGKEYDTGKTDDEGNPIVARHGGLLGAIKKITLDPVTNGVKYLKNTMVDFVKKDIMKPLKDGVKPIANMFKNMFESIGKGVTGVLNHFFETKLGVPVQEFLTDKILKPIGGAAKKIVSFPFKFMGSVVSAPFKLLGFVGNNIRANQIKGGRDFGSTAEERLAWRDQHKIRSKKIFGSSILRRFDGTLFNSDGYRTVDENIAAEDDNGIEVLINSLTQMNALHNTGKQNLTNVTREIRDLVTSQFDDTGAPGMGASGRILAQLKKGNTEKAFKLISTLKSRDGKTLSTEAANALISSLRDPLQEYNILSGARNMTDTEIDEINRKLNEFGFRKSRSGKYDYDNILKLLKSERTGRKKTGEWSIEDSAEKQIAAASDNTQQMVRAMDNINNTLQNVLYCISNGKYGAITSDEFNLKHDEDGNIIKRCVKDENGNDLKDENGNYIEEEVRVDDTLSDRTRNKVQKLQQRTINRSINTDRSSKSQIETNLNRYRKHISSLKDAGYDIHSINKFEKDGSINLNDKTSVKIINVLGALKKSGCKISDEVVIALSKSSNVQLRRRGIFGRKQSLFDDICDYISTVGELTDIKRATKLANMYEGDWANLRLVLNTINKSKTLGLGNKLRADIKDDKTFSLIMSTEYGTLNTILDYMMSHPLYWKNYSLKDALSKDGVHIYGEERAIAKKDRAAAEEEASRGLEAETENVVTRAYGRRFGRKERAVVSRDELIVDPADIDVSDYRINTYAFGRGRKSNDYIRDLDAFYDELGYGEDQQDKRDLVLKYNNLLMRGETGKGKKLRGNKRKNLSFLIQQYKDKGILIDDAENEEEKNKYIAEQTEALKQIKTYMSFDTTDDGDVVKKLIDKRGDVYINKHDPANKKGLKEGQINNQNNALLEKISNGIGNIKYAFTEKTINKDGDTIASITGKILGKVGKFLLGGTLIGGGLATLLKLIGGDNLTNKIGSWWSNTAQPAASSIWNNNLKPFFTETVPNVASNAWNGIVNFGSGVKDWVFNNIDTVGKAIGNGALFAANLITQAAPTVVGTFWEGLENLTGMTASGNKKSLGEKLATSWLRGVLRGSSGNTLKNFTANLPTIGGKVISKVTNAGTTAAGTTMSGLSHLLRTDSNIYKGLAQGNLVEDGVLRGLQNFGTRDSVTIAPSILGKVGLYDDQYKAILQNINDSAVSTLQKGTLARQDMSAADATAEVTTNGLANFSRSQVSKTLYNVAKSTPTGEEASTLLTAAIKGTSRSAIEGAIGAWLVKIARALEEPIRKFVSAEASETLTAAISRSSWPKKLLAKVMDLVPNALTKLGTNIASGGLATVVFALADFLTPLIDGATTQSILGISTEPTFIQRLLAAVLNCIMGLPVVAGGLIPPEVISWMLFDPDVGIIRDLDVAGITSARVESNTIVNEFNRVMGTNYDVDTYNYVINGKTSLWNATGGAIINAITGNTRDNLMLEATTSAAKQGIDLNQNIINTWRGATIDDDGNVVFKNATTNKDGNVVISDEYGNQQTLINNSATSQNISSDGTGGYLERITTAIEGLFSYFTGDTIEHAEVSDYATSSSSDTEFIKDIAKAYGFTYEEAVKFINEQYGTSGQGSGRYSQRDKSINMRYNKPGDTIYQDISSSGCGPIAATNLINRHIKGGMGFVTPNDAAKYALKHGYKETNGGTLPTYFKDYFAKNDISSYITSNKSEMRKAIKNGQQVVLMGKDPSYGMGNNPYGPNPHYVVATGMSGSNIIIDNPEEDSEYITYDADDTLRKSSKAVITGSRYGMGGGTAAEFHQLDQDTSSLEAYNAKKKKQPWISTSAKDDGKGHKVYNYSGYPSPIVLHYPIASNEKETTIADIPFYNALNSIKTEQWTLDDINKSIINYNNSDFIADLLSGETTPYAIDKLSKYSNFVAGNFADFATIYEKNANQTYNNPYDYLNNLNGENSLYTLSNLVVPTVDTGLLTYITQLAFQAFNSAKQDGSNKSVGELLKNKGTFDIVKNNIANLFNNKYSKSDITNMPSDSVKDEQTGKYFSVSDLFFNSPFRSIVQYFNNKSQRTNDDYGTFFGSIPDLLAYSSKLHMTAGSPEQSITPYQKVKNTIKGIFDTFGAITRQNLFIKTYENILSTMKSTGYNPLQKITTEGNFVIPDEQLGNYNYLSTDSYSAKDISERLLDHIKTNGKSDWYDYLTRTIASVGEEYSTSDLIARYNERFLNSVLALDKWFTNTNPAGDAITTESTNIEDISKAEENEKNRKILSYKSTLQQLKMWSEDQSKGDGTNYNNAELDQGKANVVAGVDHASSQILYDALRATYPEENGVPKFLTPDFLVTLYKKLVEYNLKNNPYIYSSNAAPSNTFTSVLKDYKLHYNPYDQASIPTVFDYDSDSGYNIARALVKIMKGVTPNVGFADQSSYYKSVLADASSSNIPSLVGALQTWEKDKGNFEDYLETFFDVKSGMFNSSNAVDDLQNNILNPIFKDYFVNSNKSVDIIDKISSLNWGDTYNLIHDLVFSNTHRFTEDDLNYLTSFYNNELLPLKVNNNDYTDKNGKFKSIATVLEENPTDPAFFNIRAFKVFIDRLKNSVNTAHDINKGYRGNYIYSAANYLYTGKEGNKIGFDENGNAGTSVYQTPEEIISNLITTIDNPNDGIAMLRFGSSEQNSSTSNIVSNKPTLFDKFAKLSDLEKKQVMLQALTLSDNGMPSKSGEDTNSFDFIRYAFAGNGPMPYEMFDQLYLQNSDSDSNEVNTRINNYFTDEYKKLAAANFATNAMNIFENIENQAYLKYLPSGVPDSAQAAYAKAQIKAHPEYIFHYLPYYSKDQLYTDLNNMNDKLGGNASENDTTKTVFGPLANYLIPSYKNRNSALDALFNQTSYTVSSTGETDDRGKTLVSSDLSEMAFDNMAFEDLSQFSNISASEVNAFIKKKYDVGGAKDNDYERPLRNTGSTFVSMANKYQVNPRFVLAVMWWEFNLGRYHDAKDHLDKFNFISIMNKGEQGASGMWDFSKGAMTCDGVVLGKCSKYTDAIENAFKFFSLVSFKKRNQRTLFSLNYKNGYSFAGGYANWINAIIPVMKEFTANTKVSYITPTDSELRFFKGLEGGTYLTDTLPEQGETEESNGILDAVWNIVKGIFGIDAVNFLNNGNATSALSSSSSLTNSYFNSSKFGDARDFFSQAFEDAEGNSVYKGMSSGFGPRNLSVDGYNLGQHYGIDLTSTAGENTIIRTPVSGTVIDSGFRDDGYGNRVLILDDNADDPHVHLFGHLSKVASSLPKINGTVSRGDIVGNMGTTGISTGNHLHYGVQVPYSGGQTFISNKYFGNKSRYSGVANDGLTWESNTTSDNFNPEYGWVNPDQYIAEYEDKMLPEPEVVESSNDDTSIAVDYTDAANTALSMLEYTHARDKAETGMGSGKSSLSDQLITNGLKKKASEEYGVGGSAKNIKLSPAGAAIVGDAMKNAHKSSAKSTTASNYGKGGSASVNSTPEEVEILKQISATLIAIDKKTAANNEFLVAFLKAVQNGEISSKSSTFNSIVNALSGANSSSSSSIDASTNTLINTMTDIVRQ